MDAETRADGAAWIRRGWVAALVLVSGNSWALSNPPQSIPPSPDFTNACSATAYDNSVGCVSVVLQAIASARAQEGVGPMELPSNWYSLTPDEQLFAATDLEIVDRGLPPMEGLASALDPVAQQAAVADGDPDGPPSNFPWTAWGGNWAGGEGNPLEAIYYWMYDDGLNSSNEECTPQDTSGCWGHRDNILGSYACLPCVMGVGFAYDFPGGGSQDLPDWTQLFVDSSGSPALDFAWSQVTPFLDGGAQGNASVASTSTASTVSTQSSSSTGTGAGSTGGATTSTVGATGTPSTAGAASTGTGANTTTGGGSGAGTSGGDSGAGGGFAFGTTTASSSAKASGGCSTGGAGSSLLAFGLLLGLGRRSRRAARRSAGLGSGIDPALMPQ